MNRVIADAYLLLYLTTGGITHYHRCKQVSDLCHQAEERENVCVPFSTTRNFGTRKLKMCFYSLATSPGSKLPVGSQYGFSITDEVPATI